MAADDLVVNIGGTSASYDAAARTAGAATAALEKRLAAAAVAQEQLNRAVVQYGAASKEAAAASKFNEAALARVKRAQATASIASKRAAEQQIADARAVAAAQERQAAAQATAVRKIGSTAGAIGAAAAVGLGLAAKAAADFEAKMAQVRSLLPEADKGQTAGLADAAKGFTDIGVSATQAADAEIELVKAGISAADIQGGALPAALTLAAAGQLDVADATSIAAQAMTQFQLQGRDLPHVADLLAAGADKALGSVQDLGEGLQYSGLTAHQLGLSVDETVATLAEFAQAGLIGSQGGAAFQQMLLRLENPTAKSSDALDSLGISLYDAKGQFVGMSSLAGQLHDKLGDVDQATRLAALSTIFGSRAVRAANVLYQDGAAGVDAWQKKVEDSGFAAEQAAGKMDSLSGDMQKLRAQVTNAAIDFGEQLQPALRSATQGLSGFVGFLDSIPGPLKEAAALTLAFTAAVGVGVFVYTRARTALASMGTTLGVVSSETGAATAKMNLLRAGSAAAGIGLLELSNHTEGTAKGLSQIGAAALIGNSILPGWGAAIGAAAATAANLETAGFKASASMDALNASLEKNGAFSADARKGAGIVSEQQIALLDKAGISVQTYSAALRGNDDAFGEVLAGAKQFGPWADLLVKPVDQARDAADAYADHLSLLADQIHKVTPEQAALGNATREMGGTMLDTAGDALAQGKALEALNKSAHDAGETSASLEEVWRADVRTLADATAAAKDYQAALDGLVNTDSDVFDAQRAVTRGFLDAKAAIKENGTSLSALTSKGNENIDMVEGLIENSKNLLVAERQAGAGPIELARSLRTQRAELVSNLAQLGFNRKAVENLIDTYGLTPKLVTTLMRLTGADTAAQKAREVAAAIRSIPQSYSVHIGISSDRIPNYGINQAHGGVVDYYARGGVRENHVAQIAPAGAWRVWAEPETGGEAYIPLAPAKRTRSRAVASETVSRLGGVAYFAQGAIVPGVPQSRYMTDPSLVAEVRALRTMLDRNGVNVRNAHEVATGVRSVANTISRRNIGDNDAHKAMQAVEPG